MGVLQGLTASGSHLYAAWKGEPDDDRIFYSAWSGSGSWSAQALIPGNTSAGPALGEYSGSLYAAWKGEWSDPRVFYSKLSGSSWDAQKQIPNAYSDTGPSLCPLSGKLVAAWKSVFDQSLYYATFDGTNWTSPSQIAGVGSSVGPTLALYGGKMYAVWKGEDTDERLWYATYDGTSWSAQNTISGVGTSVGASIAGVSGKLYAVWKGEGNDQSIWYSAFDGTSWSTQTQVGGDTSQGVAIAEFNGNLYAMCKGQNSDVSLYNAEFTVSTGKWSSWSKDIPGNTGPDTFTTLLPTPTSGNTNYVYKNSNGGFVNGATVIITVVEDIIPDSTGNYSFQVNCFGPKQASGAAPFVWQQYGYRIAANELFFWVNDFRQQDLPGSPYINWDSRSMPNNTGVVAVSNNVLPAGWQLTTRITTDSAGTVTGFSFSVAQPNGAVLNSPAMTLEGIRSFVTSANLAPINNFQVIMVGENGGRTTDFSSGQGIFLCFAGESITATAFSDESGEGSNVVYSPLPASYPNGEFYQQFGIGLVPA